MGFQVGLHVGSEPWRQMPLQVDSLPPPWLKGDSQQGDLARPWSWGWPFHLLWIGKPQLKRLDMQGVAKHGRCGELQVLESLSSLRFLTKASTIEPCTGDYCLLGSKQPGPLSLQAVLITGG